MTGTVKIEVVGLGQCSLDLLGQLDCYPGLDQKAELSSLVMQGGGPVATALVTLSRLGVPVAMAGAVGDDDHGRKICDGLLAERIDCTHLRVVPGHTSQVAFIAVDGQGHRNIFWHRGNAVPDVSKSLECLLARDLPVLHLDGLHIEAALHAAEIARRRNAVTVLDAGTLRPGLERLLPLVDHLVVSEHFARQATGHQDVRKALKPLCEHGAAVVTVTRGLSGSLSMSRDGAVFHQPAFTVDAVDTTGCGDVFHGGYIYGLLQRWDLPRTLRFAAACAALKTRALGGRTAIPGLSEVEAFLKSRAD